MRILHFICSPAAGGAETYVRDLCILMCQKGHDVHVVFLESAVEGGRDLAFEQSFLESLAAESISYSFIGKDARKRPWLGGLRLRKVVNSFQADVVHCHLYYALLFSFFLLKTPILYTHHNIKLGLPRAFYRIFDLKVKAYIGICSACKKLLEGGGRARSVIQINNAVSKQRIPTRVVSNHRFGSEIICVFVGSLGEQKNLTLMLEAFARIQDIKVRLEIVGEGPDRSKLENLTKSLGVDGRVRFLGNVTNVVEVLAKSDVFLMSSAWEGLPIALIEATLAGLPVVVTNVGGCAEVVHQCANGFVVDSLDVDDYLAALEKMVADEKLRYFFSRNAIQFSEEFKVEKSVEKHLLLYQKVVHGDASKDFTHHS
jgi:glycosyltransferase involved in cell wall biosynthesis